MRTLACSHTFQKFIIEALFITETLTCLHVLVYLKYYRMLLQGDLHFVLNSY